MFVNARDRKSLGSIELAGSGRIYDVLEVRPYFHDCLNCLLRDDTGFTFWRPVQTGWLRYFDVAH